MKKWQQPTVEVLNVSMTMAGLGKTYIDKTLVNGDFDITDKADPGSIIIAPVPGGIIS